MNRTNNRPTGVCW